jgi:ABC-type multidrug transport system fused ATPase/permease subunit
MSKSDY